MGKYALLCGYLPSLEYSGFSKQLHDQYNLFTVLLSALKKARLVTADNIHDVKYASRTDRGVGAISQIITLNTENPPILPEINSFLPELIHVLGYSAVPENFNPRSDAILRIYSYFFYQELDLVELKRIQEVLGLLLGVHDFRNFSKRDPSKTQNTIRNLQIAELLAYSNDIYQLRFGSKAFLWQQIRRMVQHVLDIANGNCTLDNTRDLLDSGVVQPKPNPAPPQYLILENILYENFKPSYHPKIMKKYESQLLNAYNEQNIKTELLNYLIRQIKDF